VLRGGAIPSPRRRRDARPRRGTIRSPGGASRDERQCSLDDENDRSEGPRHSPQILEPFAVGVYEHPDSIRHPLPVQAADQVLRRISDEKSPVLAT
jgi:hypothetical protein